MKRFLALAALSLLAFHLPAATSRDVLRAFRNPTDAYRPYVRWWWNGDKVDEAEIRREIRLLKEAGIAGVEINPISFPNPKSDDLGKKSLTWLSDEWIDMLGVAFDEAKKNRHGLRPYSGFRMAFRIGDPAHGRKGVGYAYLL